MPAVDLDTRVDMYLRPTATGVYTWVPISRANGMVIQREQDIVITDGNQNLNTDTGVPNRCRFSVHDPAGHLNRKNPMGAYWGSIGLGVQTRVSVLRVDDQAGRTVANTNWGAVGNTAGDTWTAGVSSGGVVAATDWSVSGGALRHSLPVDGAYRLSELSKTTRPFTNVEALLELTVPTANVTGTGALATEVWLRTIDVSNFLAVSLAYQIDETLQIAIYDRTAGVNRYLLGYTAIPGLSLTTATNYLLRCHVEGGTVRAKVWPASAPEPQGWQVTGSDAVIREGYVSVASYAFSGNTNAKPLVFAYSYLQLSIPMFFGEIDDLVPAGDGKNEPHIVDVSAAGILDRLITSKSPSKSVMRRSRSGARTWQFVSNLFAIAGDTRTFTVPTASIGNVVVGDFFFLQDPTSGRRKEDAQFVITGAAVAGANTNLTFTPDARDAVVAGNRADVYRGALPATQPIAYWPMEDGDSATQISSGLASGAPMSIVNAPDFGAESGFSTSASVLKINAAELTGNIVTYADPGVFTISFLLSMPATDEGATGTDLLQWYTTGTGYSWDLRYAAAGNGSLQLLVFNSSLALLFDSGTIDFGLRGDKCLLSVVCKQVGGTVTYSILKIKEADGTVGGTGPSTVTGVTTLGVITQIRVNPGGGYDDVGFGHLTIIPAEWTVNTMYFEFVGWNGQAALHRYYRLCYEENIPLTYRSNWDVLNTNVGKQKIDKLGELFKKPAAADGGFLIGARGAMALEYISRGASVNIEPMATLDAALGHVKLPFRPTADYTYAENQVTVRRIDGTTAVAELTTGAMSTQDPPNGIRIREGGYDLSLGSDAQAQLHADWRLSLGTTDDYRLPRLDLTPAGANALSVERLLSLGVGMRVDIKNLTSSKIYDDLQQLISGIAVRLGMREYPQLSLVTQPYGPYRTFALTGNNYARPGMTDTVLGSTLTTTQVGAVTFTSQSGYYLVTTDPTDFPMTIIVEGEAITLSGVSGDVSPQTGTISARSVNGVVKSHAVNETVQLYRLNRYQF